MPFRFQNLEVPVVVRIHAKAFEDSRGSFSEIYKWSDFERNGIPHRFVQDNHSHSVQGVLGGLHYQRYPKAQTKLVMVLRGAIFDVAADIRRGSPTYGKSVGVTPSAEDHSMLYAPVGFVHGFCVLTREADVLYRIAEEYMPYCEGGMARNERELAIEWPAEAPVLSQRDACLPPLRRAEHDFAYEGAAQ